MLERARHNLGRFGGRVQFEHGWFADVLARRDATAQLVLLDLGLASYHFDHSGRGFSSAASNRSTCVSPISYRAPRPIF